jgi:hypothetical protein
MMKSRRSSFLVYGLIDPRTRLIFYIGLSSSALHRPKQHRRRSNSGCRDVVHELQKLGLDYEIAVLEEVRAESELPATERWWIAYGRACGWPLTNCTRGGEFHRNFRKPGFGVSDEDFQQARFVNFCNTVRKNGEVTTALETAQRCLSAELFEWFRATVMEHRLDFCIGVPPRLVCSCGQAELLTDDAALPAAVERMNAHLREMARLRNDEASKKRQWMLHLS